jgi:uncharacterized repeat protein (TIGR02543 family)
MMSVMAILSACEDDDREDHTINPPKKEVYTIVYDSQGGGDFPQNRVTQGNTIDTEHTPQKDNHIFLGWYTDPQYGQKIYFPYYPDQSRTLYAHYHEIEDYIIQFNALGGTPVPQQTVTEGKSLNMLPTTTKPGFDFEGWSTENGGIIPITPPFYPTENTELFAIWERLPEIYTVSFNSMGGSSLPNQQITEGNRIGNEPKPTKSGYVFFGWSTQQIGEEKISFPFTPTSSVTLYAQWVEIIEGSQGLSYQINEDGASYAVTGSGSAATGEITISNYYNNKPVTKIVYGAFREYTGITGIVIPDTVSVIDGYAFYGCTSLENITISGAISTIGHYSFYHCTSLESISFPEGLTSIGNFSFWSCSSLIAVNLPSSLDMIGSSAFQSCTSLTNITIPEGVMGIGSAAFEQCHLLESFTIPSGVSIITNSVFRGCYSLSSISIPEGIRLIEQYAFYNCDSLSEITLPSSVTQIGNYAFHGCSSLENLTLPEGIKNIGINAFAYCSSITSITIPSGLNSINSYAFYQCDSLSEVIISEGVSSIGSYSFAYCDKLTQITIPDSMTNIYDSAFHSCTSLLEVTIGSNVTQIRNDAFYNCGAIERIIIKSDTVASGLSSTSAMGHLLGNIKGGEAVYIKLGSTAGTYLQNYFTVQEATETLDGVQYVVYIRTNRVSS